MEYVLTVKKKLTVKEEGIGTYYEVRLGCKGDKKGNPGYEQIDLKIRAANRFAFDQLVDGSRVKVMVTPTQQTLEGPK